MTYEQEEWAEKEKRVGAHCRTPNFWTAPVLGPQLLGSSGSGCINFWGDSGSGCPNFCATLVWMHYFLDGSGGFGCPNVWAILALDALFFWATLSG